MTPDIVFESIRALIHKHGITGARKVLRRAASRKHVGKEARRTAVRAVRVAA